MTASGVTSTLQARRQTHRAWFFLLTAFIIFVFTCGGAGGAGYWYRGHATVKRTAQAEVVQGALAYVLPAYQVNWSALPSRATAPSRDPAVGAGGAEIHEGDKIRTLNGTHVYLTLWDGSTVEVFERTELTVTELRSTQYINRASAVTLQLLHGLVRVALAPGDYNRSRFQVEAGTTTVLMKEGEGQSGGGSFLVEASPGPDENSTGAVRASVRRGVGAVRVAGQTGELRLSANEQTIVPPGGTPGPPTPARRDLLANGTFVPSPDGGKEPYPSWQVISSPGQTEGTFGQLLAVSDQVDGNPVSALEIYRSLNSVDPANTGLRQVLDVSVTDLASLLISADIEVMEQNVPGGGQAGTEFPMIVRINYYDASGTLQNHIWGFYTVPDPSGTKPVNGTQVDANKWFSWSADLRDLRTISPLPVRLDSIEVYASGHGYRARITNLTIVGAE